MTFISYAQNYEDVMLWRALKHIEKGFYIDVGAAWPKEHSVTYSFYINGWHGINIEPNQKFFGQLATKRPNDINLPLAIGEKFDSATMYFFGETGLSTLDKDIAHIYKEKGRECIEKQIDVNTLNSIFEKHIPENQAVHFLKIDVEGLEKSVLKSNNWELFRPWVVVVEATLPMSQVENHEEWESILLNAHYCLAYADGLNRFYVAVEHEELLAAFKYPPNVFDEFKVITEIQAEAKAEQAETKAEQAEAKAEQAEAKAEQAETKAEQAETKAEQLHTQLHHVYTSRSWRLTKPLRELRPYLKWLSRLLKKSTTWCIHLSKHATRRGIVKLRAYSLRRPALKARVKTWLHDYPKLEAKLRRLAATANQPHAHTINTKTQDTPSSMPVSTSKLSNLTPDARRIYSELTTAIAQRKQENR